MKFFVLVRALEVTVTHARYDHGEQYDEVLFFGRGVHGG